MGIAMPRYYNRYCYETDRACIPTANQDVPLNRYIFQPSDRGKILEGVALGNLLHAYKTAIGEETSHDINWYVPYPENLEIMPFDFLSIWEELIKVRNDAAHSRSVDRALYGKTEDFFGVFQESFISILYMIKENLRSE